MIKSKSLVFAFILVIATLSLNNFSFSNNQESDLERKELSGITFDLEEYYENYETDFISEDSFLDRTNINAIDNSDYIVKTSIFFELSDTQKDALERVPDWMHEDFIDAMRRLEAEGDFYADFLLAVEEPLWWDEVAFIISHTAIGLLTANYFDPEIIIKNVELIYMIDPDLQYVDIVDHGTPGVDKDFYSTTKYRIKDGEDFIWMEIDKDVYYWFVVHPKMSDEDPSWSSEVSDRSSTYGYFWREYLYFNPNENYDYQKYYLLNHPNEIKEEDVNDWGYSAQGYLKDFTSENPEKIITNENGDPVFVEYPYGLGTIFATTMPLEEAYINGNKLLLENTLIYSNCEKTLSTNAKIAIIKDRDPFGSKTIEAALTELGYSYDVYSSSDLAEDVITFDNYGKVIIPSGQSLDFYQILSDNAGKIHGWVNYYDRTFEFHGAVEDSSDDWAGIVMPGNFSCSSQFDNLTDKLTLNEYPLLKDFLKDVNVYWDGETASLQSWRDVLPDSNALDVVGNWVARLLPYRAHDNRPNQPNQICFEHNGNCGEIQDLMCAASRTALIPNQPINNHTWDHVWNEFWSAKDKEWKPYQVDWNGSHTSINVYSLGYDKDHGGGKELACVIGNRGDGYHEIVIPRYTDYANLTVTVLDGFDNPVDRAKVSILVTPNGGGDFMKKIVGMSSFTNSDGKAFISVGNNRSFWAKVASAKGSVTVPEKIITDSVGGENYTYQFKLNGIMPSHYDINELDNNKYDEDRVMLQIDYSAVYEKFYGGPSLTVTNGYALKMFPGQIDFFMVDDNNRNSFSSGSTFDGYHYLPDSVSGSVEFTLSDPKYFMIFANPDVTQAVQYVKANIDIYENAGKIWVMRKEFEFSDLILPQQTMELKFNDLGSPPIIMHGGFGNNDISSEIGGTLTVNAFVYDPDGQDNIDKVELYLGGKATGIALSNVGDWGSAVLYSFETTIPPNAVPAGNYLIEIVAKDKDGNMSSLWPYLHTFRGIAKVNTGQEISSAIKLDNDKIKQDLFTGAMCGYGDTILADAGGDLKIYANINNGYENIENLELAFNGNPLGIYLQKGQDEGYYFFIMKDLVGAQPENDYLFEIIANLKNGTKENIFPYLKIK